MLRRILVPLDGSSLAQTALPFAGAIARRMGGEVRLVHVVEVPAALAYPEYRAEDRAWAERQLDDTAYVSSLSGVPVSTSVREGGILDELRREAAEWPADLVVMTTHGRGGFSRLWMGSVADRFVRSSAHPVVLVRPEGRSPASPASGPRRIVVPLDGSALAETALPFATSLAKAFGARLVLLRGLVHFGTFDVGHLSLSPKSLEEERREAETYLAERAGAARSAGIETETVVLTEPGLAEAISARAADDYIVMTTNGRGGLDRAVFGSVADKVVRSATCPVMVIRPERAAQNRELEELSREIAAAADSVTLAAEDRG
jgi:nucleotide-binding universal stress UspA family protein